jgi:signal transduction histidine kinase
MFDSMTEDVEKEIEKIAKVSPQTLIDEEWLDTLNQELDDNYSFLIVRVEDEIVYWGGNETYDNIREGLIKKLPDWVGSSQDLDTSLYTGHSSKCLIKTKDFELNDKSKASIFIITRVENVLPEVKTLIWEMIFAICITLIITAIVLCTWIYRSILSPISKLNEATQEIRDGNMDFVLEAETHDEIGELFQNFDEMRMRLKESAEEKIKYDRESKELISNISHDLKTPITAILGYMEGILEGVAHTPEKREKYLKTVYNKAKDMSRLIEELTFYTKIDTNKIPYNFCKINVYDYFCDCVEEVGVELESRGILLSYTNSADRDAVIIADGEQLKRVIDNIIGNSVKYMDKTQGIIAIRVKDLSDFIQVEIEDNGCGIASRDLENIFNRFYRTDASRNSSKGGSGIGLSIVKKIIEDHGGRIWCTSTEHIGTVMHFVIRKYQEVKYE